jgi:hypothetical protein
MLCSARDRGWRPEPRPAARHGKKKPLSLIQPPAESRPLLLQGAYPGRAGLSLTWEAALNGSLLRFHRCSSDVGADRTPVDGRISSEASVSGLTANVAASRQNGNADGPGHRGQSVYPARISRKRRSTQREKSRLSGLTPGHADDIACRAPPTISARVS